MNWKKFKEEKPPEGEEEEFCQSRTNKTLHVTMD